LITPFPSLLEAAIFSFIREKSMLPNAFLGIREPADDWDAQGYGGPEDEQLSALGMHTVGTDDADEKDEESEEDDALEEEEVAEGTDDKNDPSLADPSDDLDKDGLKELEEMEQQLLQEEPLLDFTMAEEEE
jgi:hypothetical protein